MDMLCVHVHQVETSGNFHSARAVTTNKVTFRFHSTPSAFLFVVRTRFTRQEPACRDIEAAHCIVVIALAGNSSLHIFRLIMGGTEGSSQFPAEHGDIVCYSSCSTRGQVACIDPVSAVHIAIRLRCESPATGSYGAVLVKVIVNATPRPPGAGMDKIAAIILVRQYRATTYYLVAGVAAECVTVGIGGICISPAGGVCASLGIVRAVTWPGGAERFSGNTGL